MKYIAIFEDNKGFTKVLEFAQLPHKYDFIEYKPASVMSSRADINSSIPQNSKITFVKKGEPQEVYGQTVQKYYQEQ